MVEITLVVLCLFSHTFTSDNGLFQGSAIYGKGFELFAESFTLYDHNLQVIYTKTNPRAHTFFLSNTGVVFATDERDLYLYKQNGEELFLKLLNYPNGFGFSSDNELFFASDKDGIFAYSSNGELMYTFTPGRLFASTDKGKMVATISTDTLFVYEDGEQKFIKQLSTPYIRNLSFSDNEKSIIVELPSGTEVFDSETGERR